MTHREATIWISSLKRRYFFKRLFETILISIASFFLAISLLLILGISTITAVIIAAMSGGLAFILRSRGLSLFNLNETNVTRYLSLSFPNLEESTDLLLIKDDLLNTIERIQKERTVQKMGELKSSVHLPHQLGIATIALLTGLLTYSLITWLGFSIHPDSLNSQPEQAINGNAVVVPAGVIKQEVKIIPPSYTRQPPYTSKDLNLTIPAGSHAAWSFVFSGKCESVMLVFSGLDTLPLTGGKSFNGQRLLTEKGFYYLTWKESGKFKSSDYYKIDVTRDMSPKIEVNDLPQFTHLSLKNHLSVQLKVTITDDYSIKDAWIIATVSKGSGESVKFREEQLKFTQPSIIEGKKIVASRTLDFSRLGMEPGDELYFYIQAIDNKVPYPNESRSETWFIALEDTARMTTIADTGAGVDLMPEYFRSQRQIIIDTEKLLALKAQNKVTKDKFRFTSNELGYDQKVLRIRYGQFLGEEFEDHVLPTEEQESAEENTEGEKTDEEEKNKDGKEKNKETDHDHEDEAEGINLEQFTHQHDKGDEATFFMRTTKTKLKAALTLMWESELQLRLYEPARSLPYQYQILNILKEISNDSRIYVHRTGFDPPPLKEERRMTGELKDMGKVSMQYTSEKKVQYPAIRKALTRIENILSDPVADLNQVDRILLVQAGNELAGIATDKPGSFLSGLTLIKQISNQEIKQEEMKTALYLVRSVLWRALPQETPAPTRHSISLHSLDQALFEQLESHKHE